MANDAEDTHGSGSDRTSGSPTPSPRVVETQDDIPLQDLPPKESESRRRSQQTPPDGTETEDNHDENRRRTINMGPDPKRTVNRKLRGVQLFMITLNATLGTGLYWRGGQMLWVAGPLAVFLSFILVGALAWAVMQCIAEMLCIWPVPGALSFYVANFVDAELGITVGVAYWFTYSSAFAALMTVAASELTFWMGDGDNTAIKGGIVYFLIPLCLILLNAFEIEIYGWFEVITGSLKIMFLFIIMICLLVIKGIQHSEGRKSWKDATGFDEDAAGNSGTAFFIATSIATFAYVGVEVVAAAALEARWSKSKQSKQPGAGPARIARIRHTVKFTAVYFPFLTTFAYTLSSLFASFDIERDDKGISRFSWVPHNTTNVASYFVAIADNSGIPGLASTFNVFLVFTALTCANTNLFVASRSLFGLTSRLKGGPGQPRYIRFLASFGQTNRHRVPLRAVTVSAVAFFWVPFVELTGEDKFIEVLTQMSSVGVIIVWACNCWAFMRYYECIKQHRVALERERVPQVRRWDSENDDYPYRSHWQPYLSWVALGGCLFILVVANGSALWHGFEWEPFLSAYLFIIVFLLLWAVLKYSKDAKWALVDLSHSPDVIRIIKGLHEKRFEATFEPPTNSEAGSRS